MEQEIILASEAVDGHFRFHPTSLEIVNEPPFERWVEMFEALKRAGAAIQFWLGDMINYGERAYGEKYSQFLEVRQGGTLRNYAWVADNVPASLRNDNLSWDHHRRVASLPEPEQREWLDKADQEEWSARQLDREIAKETGGRPVLLYNGQGRLEAGEDGWWLARFRPGFDFDGGNGLEVLLRVVGDVGE